MDEILAWIFIGLSVIEVVLGSYTIGKPRRPRTAGEYILNSIILALLVYLLLKAYIYA